MGEPRCSMGLITACRVGTVWLGIFFSHFTITEGVATGGAACARSAPFATTRNSARRRLEAIRWFSDLFVIVYWFGCKAFEQSSSYTLAHTRLSSSLVTEAGGICAVIALPVDCRSLTCGVTSSFRSKVLWARRSELVSTVMVPDFIEALLTVIFVSRISFTLGFTRVSIKFLLSKDAEPFNPRARSGRLGRR